MKKFKFFNSISARKLDKSSNVGGDNEGPSIILTARLDAFRTNWWIAVHRAGGNVYSAP